MERSDHILSASKKVEEVDSRNQAGLTNAFRYSLVNTNLLRETFAHVQHIVNIIFKYADTANCFQLLILVTY